MYPKTTEEQIIETLLLQKYYRIFASLANMLKTCINQSKYVQGPVDRH